MKNRDARRRPLYDPELVDRLEREIDCARVGASGVGKESPTSKGVVTMLGERESRLARYLWTVLG